MYFSELSERGSGNSSALRMYPIQPLLAGRDGFRLRHNLPAGNLPGEELLAGRILRPTVNFCQRLHLSEKGPA